MPEDISNQQNPVQTRKKYGLERPSRNYAINSLSRFLGENQANLLWIKACESCNASEDTEDLTDLEHVFKYLSKESGAVGVLGRSLVIRTVSYRTLNKE